MTQRKLVVAIAFAALPTIAQAAEIRPTPAMLARARETIKPYDANDRLEYHFRKWGGGTIWVCAYHVGGNGGFCTQTPLSEVKRIDERAEDFCAHSEDGGDPSHALTGEAIALQYKCHAGRMTREPYADVFDEDGYQYSEWKPLR
jgi:hypothetical protein